VHAVDGVSLDVYPKEIVGLVGESGSESRPSERPLWAPSQDGRRSVLQGEKLPQLYKPADFQRYARQMQMIFQDPYSSLNPRMTVGEIIGEGLRLSGGFSSSQVREKVVDWLRNVGLEPDHASRIHTSSPEANAKGWHCASAHHATGVCGLRRAESRRSMFRCRRRWCGCWVS
jgi:ABC-type microcin C transport system duplicated ATPase subunit YejF